MSDNETTGDIRHDNDIMRRRRVHQLAEECADLLKDIGERVRELDELHVGTNDIVDLTFAAFPPAMRDALAVLAPSLPAQVDLVRMMITDHANANDPARRAKDVQDWIGKHTHSMPEMDGIMASLGNAVRTVAENPNLHRSPMEVLIDRLFEEAPKLEDKDGKAIEGQAPALQCHVILRPGMTIQGSLSRTAEGALRMLTPTELKDPKTGRPKPVLAEQFFDVDDVVAIALEREVTMSGGPIIHRS